tara:strand:+ start:1321 stop:1866 length:546 start_codon:yes stop_codon:yes gene_type:complete
MSQIKSAVNAKQYPSAENTVRVGVIMGSESDWPTMKFATDILSELKITYETKIISAHRTPERMNNYGKTVKERGLLVVIAGAGGAAHLPGMIAALTTLPVLGVPIQSKTLSGLDSLLSIVQMPGGIPVGTLSIGKSGAKNAGLLAASIVALSDQDISERLNTWRLNQTLSVDDVPQGYLQQ